MAAVRAAVRARPQLDSLYQRCLVRQHDTGEDGLASFIVEQSLSDLDFSLSWTRVRFLLYRYLTHTTERLDELRIDVPDEVLDALTLHCGEMLSGNPRMALADERGNPEITVQAREIAEAISRMHGDDWVLFLSDGLSPYDMCRLYQEPPEWVDHAVGFLRGIIQGWALRPDLF
jgi:hypothetical protein